MSFSKVFNARTKADAFAILDADKYIPDAATAFVRRATEAFGDDEGVMISISGHLYDGKSYDVSSLNIAVQRIKYESPK